MFAPFQYLLSIVNCMLLPPDELCPHYLSYPTLLETTNWVLHHFFLAPDPFGWAEWAFLAIFTTFISIVGYCIYDIPTRGKAGRRERTGGFWGAVDNLFGYVLGYDTQGDNRTYLYDKEEDEWLERMM